MRRCAPPIAPATAGKYGKGRGGRPWRRIRDRILQRDKYLCQPCMRAGKLEVATEVDHVNNKRGRNGKLDDSDRNLQAICSTCHQSKTRGESRKAARIPRFERKPLIPVTLVCGPSGSGKTTYVRQHAGPRDLVLDLDEIKARLSGLPMHEAGDHWVGPALSERNDCLAALADLPVRFDRCWLIVSAPTWTERNRWRDMLNADSVVLAVSPDVCKARVEPRGDDQRWHAVVDDWWKQHSTGWDETVIRG